MPDLNGYKGGFMAKADGVKVYMFCYESGYVVLISDPALTLVICIVVRNYADLPEIIRTPDTIVAEIIENGDLVFINVLAVDGNAALPPSERMNKPKIITERQPLIYRAIWDKILSKTKLDLEPMPNNGIVIVTPFRTLRLKQPIVDLIYDNGNLNAIEDGILIPIAVRHEQMIMSAIYELDIVKKGADSAVELVKPRQRTLKKMPNNIDVVKRAIASIGKELSLTSSLIDITAMSFTIRTKVYEDAQARALANRKGFSYVAIDPNIDLSLLTTKAFSYKIVKYNFSKTFSMQVTSITRAGSTILWCKSKSDDFIRKAMPIIVMSSVGIPVVFSFSISYYIKTIAMMKVNKVPVFGCGYVHDAMPRGGVGRDLVTMRIANNTRGAGKDMIATFGKSTYMEPFLSMTSVQDIVLVKNAITTIWTKLDGTTVDIMDRAIIITG
ncbi:hypothetical protein WAI453_013701 [Rhynchosporium graminicola]